MQIMTWKTGFLALTFVAIASLSNSLLVACSQNQTTANTAVSDTHNHQQVAHNGMNHSMGMNLGPADANYDLRFIDGMRLHHRGAIAMAKEAQQKSQRPEIKSLAGNIIVTQSKEENELLRNWRKDWYPQASDSLVAYGGEDNPVLPMSKEQQKSMALMEDLGAADANFDLRFMNAMIAHHEGALTMAQDAVDKSQRPEIKQLAREITASQQTEINQMKQWQQAWYKK